MCEYRVDWGVVRVHSGAQLHGTHAQCIPFEGYTPLWVLRKCPFKKNRWLTEKSQKEACTSCTKKMTKKVPDCQFTLFLKPRVGCSAFHSQATHPYQNQMCTLIKSNVHVCHLTQALHPHLFLEQPSGGIANVVLLGQVQTLVNAVVCAQARRAHTQSQTRAYIKTRL